MMINSGGILPQNIVHILQYHEYENGVCKFCQKNQTAENSNGGCGGTVIGNTALISLVSLAAVCPLKKKRD